MEKCEKPKEIRVRPDGVCPSCGSTSLVWAKDNDEIICAECGVEASAVARDAFWLFSGQQYPELSKITEISG